MTTLFLPHTPYAEDQPHAETILTFHVLRSGATAGAMASLLTSTLSTLYFGPRTLASLYPRLLLHSARGTTIGTVLAGLALGGRMYGREKIEWQDRSWRLLENKGQVEVDNWILSGAAIGAVAVGVAGRSGKLPAALNGRLLSAVIGGGGVGMSAGTAGYMGWRYGVHGGKWPDRKTTVDEDKGGVSAS